MKQIDSKCSLCISTYNWPAALYQCLMSIKSQSVLPGEIIIGDDGSTIETKKLIDRISNNFPVPIFHVWHEDDGFRLATVRNKSFAKAKGNYIIQSDGDMIFNHNFIKDHLQTAKKNTFVAGARCMLNKEISELLTSGQKTAQGIEMLKYSKKKYNGLRWIPAAYINSYFQRGLNQTKYVIGANMAFWKEDLVKVNGYNEIFTGWGKEDNDIALRLHLAGTSIRFLKFAAIAFHLHHQGASLKNFETNEILYEKTIREKIIYSPKGIDQYL